MKSYIGLLSAFYITYGLGLAALVLVLVLVLYFQGDHSPDTLKFPDISLTTRGTNVHVKQYS